MHETSQHIKLSFTKKKKKESWTNMKCMHNVCTKYVQRIHHMQNVYLMCL